MFQVAALSGLLAFVGPPETPSELSAPADQLCSPLPPAPRDIDVLYFDDIRADGVRDWSVALTYELSTGDLGEAYLEGDSAGNGEAYFAINGTIVAQATVTIEDGPVDGITSYSVPYHEADYSPELLAELMHPQVVDVMIDEIGAARVQVQQIRTEGSESSQVRPIWHCYGDHGGVLWNRDRGLPRVRIFGWRRSGGGRRLFRRLLRVIENAMRSKGESSSAATSELENASQLGTGPHLLDRPQRLGFLPSLWFWRDKENARLVKWPVRLAIVVAFILAFVVDAGWVVSGLLPVIGITITLGLIERHVRRRALERRLLAQAADGSAVARIEEHLPSRPDGNQRSRGGAT